MINFRAISPAVACKSKAICLSYAPVNQQEVSFLKQYKAKTVEVQNQCGSDHDTMVFRISFVRGPQKLLYSIGLTLITVFVPSSPLL